MAQAVMAILLRRPDNARSRPSSLLKKDEDYASIFNASLPLDLYKVCAGLLKNIEAYMREHTTLSQQDRGNLRFHVAMLIAAKLCNKEHPGSADIANIKLETIDQSHFADAIAKVKSVFDELGSTDSVSKSAEFLTKIREHVHPSHQKT